MKYLNIYFIDSNSVDINDYLFSSYIKEEERSLFSKYKVEQVRKEKIISTYLKNKYIGEYKLNEYKKPISKDKYFNISHSLGAVVLVVDEVNIGIDIEKIRDYKDDLKKYISSYEEMNYIDSNEKFFEVWTNKEALVKAFGTGLKNNIKGIPALPLNSKRFYEGTFYFNKTIKYNDYIITLSRNSDEEFEILINGEKHYG